MVDRKQADLLLQMAWKDFRALEGMADRRVFADEIFGFHVQQAAEKALKAWMALFGMEVLRTHILSALLDLLERAGEKVDEFWQLTEYQIFAVQFRYEAIGSLAEEIDRAAALKAVRRLLEHVEGKALQVSSAKKRIEEQ